MKGKFSIFMLVLALTLACNIGSAAPTSAPLLPSATPLPTQAPLLSSPTIILAPTGTNSPTATILPATPTREATGVFRLSVLVDLASEPVTREQAQAIVDEASGILLGLTGFKMEMVDFQEISSGEAVRTIVQKYVKSASGIDPNGIVLFSFGENGVAKSCGGYSYRLAGPAGYVNQFASPYAHKDEIYVGVIHFSHRFGICGYGDSETPISNVSIDGECRNQPGVTCAEKYGYSICSNLVDALYASTPTYMVSSSVVHEIMHSFGPNGNPDHYGTAECTAAMISGKNARPYRPAPFSLEEAEYYVNMCPFVFDNFVNSYRP